MSGSRHKSMGYFKGSIWYFSLSLFILMFALLIGPRVSDDHQKEQFVFNIHLPGPFGVSLNCDSPEFILLAENPSHLLNRFNPEQARPGLFAAAAVVAWPLSSLNGMLKKLSATAERSDYDPKRITDVLSNGRPEYLAYILLNIGFLLLAFYCLRHICLPWADNKAVTGIILAAIGFLLAANDVVKAFVWSPQTQMFNILAPVFCLYASLRARTGALLRRRFTISIGLLAGLGCTAYPLFVILVSCVAISSFTYAFHQSRRRVWSQTIINIIIFILLVFAPEALWIAFVLFKTGTFYQYQMESFGAVTWMFEAWRQDFGAFLTRWLENLKQLLWFAAVQAVPAVVLLVVVIASNRGIDTDKNRAPLWPLVSTSILVSAVTAVFYTSVGFLYPRLAYSIVAPFVVVVAAAAVANGRSDFRRCRSIAYWSVSAAMILAVYTVVKDGPYS
jgi:hypothetical protein